MKMNILEKAVFLICFCLTLTKERDLVRHCTSECVKNAVCMAFHVDMKTATCYLDRKRNEVTQLSIRRGFLYSNIKYWHKSKPCSEDACSLNLWCHTPHAGQELCIRELMAFYTCKSNKKSMPLPPARFDDMTETCEEIRWENQNGYLPLPQINRKHLVVKINGTLERRVKTLHVTLRRSNDQLCHMMWRSGKITLNTYLNGKRGTKTQCKKYMLTMDKPFLIEIALMAGTYTISVDEKYQCDFRERLPGGQPDSLLFGGINLDYVTTSL